ncbi:MAG TPA: hypothetical protein VMU19_05655, partial [Bryobacteraceae bacterium]|nr:hypothetical protein [Bryobacteraceae bacterium]
GTGDLAFTGEGGTAAASLEAQWEAGLAQVNPQGPLATDLMRLLTGAQGTMGMVVWASIKCQLLPAVQKRLVVSAPALGDLIEFCRQAERLKLGDELMMLNRARLGGAVEWSVLIGAAGTALFPREKLELQEKELGALASQCGLALEEAGAELGSWFDGYAEDAEPSHDIFFLCTLDAAPGYVESVLAMAGKAGYAPERIGVYIQPQHQGVSQHVEFRIPYNPAERKDAALAERLFLEASEALISQGAYFSRPYGPWADWVYSRDATASRVLRTVKRIADPCNIMNPGKLCF